VIHLSGSGDGLKGQKGIGASCCVSSGGMTDKGGVRIDYFWDIVGNDAVRINNSKDHTKRPFDPSEIIRRALSCGKIGYNLYQQNCEHFATWCRYGDAESSQVQNWALAAFGVVAIVMLAAVIAYFSGRREAQAQNKDKRRIAAADNSVLKSKQEGSELSKQAWSRTLHASKI
jgi:kelch-like protein 24/35